MTVFVVSPAIGPVSVGAILTESISSALSISSNPVESGGEISDHAHMTPRELRLEVADENAAATWNDLRDLQETLEPFTLVSGLEIIPDLLIERMDATRDSRNSRILRATVILKEVRRVEVALSDSGGLSPKPSTSAAPPATTDSTVLDSVAPEADTGDTSGTEVPEETKGSILSEVFT